MSKPLFSHLLNLRAVDTLWKTSGGALLPTDGSKTVLVPGIDGGSGTVIISGIGSAYGGNLVLRQARGTAAAPLGTLAGDVLGQCLWYGWDGNAFQNQSLIQVTAAQNWTSIARGTNIYMYTTPFGATGLTNYLLLDQGGNLTITGNNATKATGTTWINPSDPRLKQAVAPYPRGLAEVLQLQPIVYEYNGLAGTQEGQPAVGLDAEAVEPIFPECVQTRDVQLHPDDPAPTTIRLLDISAILFALINAIKELRELIPGPPVTTPPIGG